MSPADWPAAHSKATSIIARLKALTTREDLSPAEKLEFVEALQECGIALHGLGYEMRKALPKKESLEAEARTQDAGAASMRWCAKKNAAQASFFRKQEQKYIGSAKALRRQARDLAESGAIWLADYRCGGEE